MKVIAYDPYMDEEKIAAGGGKKVELEELLRESDMITIHAPLWDQTKHLLDETRLRMMKPDAYLVNTSRGGTVDQAALARVMAEGHLAGAGLDVFEKEPPSLDDPIMKLPNVIVSPHAGFYSTASLDEMHRRMATQAADAMAGKRPNNLVNPDVLSQAQDSPGLESYSISRTRVRFLSLRASTCLRIVSRRDSASRMAWMNIWLSLRSELVRTMLASPTIRRRKGWSRRESSTRYSSRSSVRREKIPRVTRTRSVVTR